MTQPGLHSDKLRRSVVAMFFAGLLVMAVLAVGLGYLFAGWGRFQPGWAGQVTAVGLVVAGGALVVWSVREQYVIGRGTPAPKVGTLALVTQGPYKYSRNPMTLGALLLYLGIGLWMGSGGVIVITGIVFSGLLMFIHNHETRELTERFGEAYLEYKERTPFLLPRWRQR